MIFTDIFVISGVGVEIKYLIHEIVVFVLIFLSFHQMFIGSLRLLGIQVIISIEQFVEQKYVRETVFKRRIFLDMFLSTGILSNANNDMYEAARLDGANGFQQFLYLTLPFVLFATTPIIISTFIANFNNFSIFYFLRPEETLVSGYFNANSADLLINWMYRLTVDKKLYALGSALSLILFAFMAIFSLIVYVSSPAYKKEDTYK